jgi:hypothetical protein
MVDQAFESINPLSILTSNRNNLLVKEGRPRKPQHTTTRATTMPRPRRLLHMWCRAVVSAGWSRTSTLVAVFVTLQLVGGREPPRKVVEEE